VPNVLTTNKMEATLDVERQFEGSGPVLSWDAAMELLGDDQVGRLQADWSVAAGVLFGKQKTAFTGVETDGAFSGSYNYSIPRPLDITTTNVDERRSKSVSAPVLDLSLGLSYEIQRVRIGAGYRW